MRLTFSALGLELDVTFGLAGSAEAEDQGAALSGGTTYATAIDVGEVETWLGETGLEMEPPEDHKRLGFR